jgi:hypothetical protein
MATLYTKTKLFLEANSKTWNDTKVSLKNDGAEDFIASWDYDIAQPTAEQIASYETSGNTAEALQTILNNRANDYPSIKDQLDKIYHSGIDEWKKVIKTTKDKYPK